MGNNNKVISDYLTFKRLSVHTEPKIKDLERELIRFSNYLNKSFDEATQEDLINFLVSLKSFKTRTINDIKVVIKSFIKHHYEDYPKRFKELDKICRNEKAEKAYNEKDLIESKEDFNELISYENDLFWKAFFNAHFFGGCRAVELRMLRVENIQDDEETGGMFLNIYSRKNKTDFKKYLPPNVAHLIKELIKSSRTKGYIFPSPTDENKPVTRFGVWDRLNRLSKKYEKATGKKIHLSPLIIRHSVATLLYNDDNIPDKRDVARQMGHSLKMRETYDTPPEKVLQRKARKIWTSKDDMPEVKKHKIEQQLEDMQKQIKELQDFIHLIHNLKDTKHEIVLEKTSKDVKELIASIC